MSPMSGTTRDAIDTELKGPDGRRYTLIDTAGIRKRTAVASSDDGAEPLSVNRALQAVRCSAPVGCASYVEACMAPGLVRKVYQLSVEASAEN